MATTLAWYPKQRAFYYGRVLEMPMPRWTAYDAKYYGLRLAAEVPTAIQERACTSADLSSSLSEVPSTSRTS